MEKNNGKRKILVITTIVCVSLLVGILGSYAFFISTGGNNTPEELSVQTGNMALTFSDGTSSFQGALEFGDSATKSFTIENTGSLEAKGRMKWSNLVNTYLEGSLTYTLSYSETEDGEYTPIIENKNVPRSTTEITEVLASNLVIPVGTTYYYKLIITLNYLTDVDQTSDLKAMLTTGFSLEEDNTLTSNDTLKTLGITAKTETPNFMNRALTDEGIYSLKDDYGISYYYRGAVENNYVKFAGFYWRIIRVNGNGSLRIIYDGNQAYANSISSIKRVALENVAWNTTNKDDTKYVGYMYGGVNGTASDKRIDLGKEGYEDSTNAIYNETPSNIKTQLETWYKTNIADRGYDDNVSDEIFCNDRSTPGSEASSWSDDTSLGYGTNATVYGARARLINGNNWYPKPNILPSFICSNKNDAFTKNHTEKSNGVLSEKVGLITADEISAAGGIAGDNNSNYYLYKGRNYWSISPSWTYIDKSSAIFYISNSGELYYSDVNKTNDVVPVINLSPEYVSQMIGDGTIGNEYRVE